MTRQDLRKPLYVEPAKWPKPPRQPDPGESLIQEKLTPLVEALVHPDESCHRAAVEHVVRTCIPAVIGRLIERLVDLLEDNYIRHLVPWLDLKLVACTGLSLVGVPFHVSCRLLAVPGRDAVEDEAPAGPTAKATSEKVRA
jgi:hypothetical protein